MRRLLPSLLFVAVASFLFGAFTAAVDVDYPWWVTSANLAIGATGVAIAHRPRADGG